MLELQLITKWKWKNRIAWNRKLTDERENLKATKINRIILEWIKH